VESEWDIISPKPKTFLVENNSTCYQREEVEIILHCEPCTNFEIKLAHTQNQGVCLHTHNKEILRCRSGGEIVIKSCDKVAYLEQRNYFIFMLFSLIISAFSTTVVYARQKFIDRNFFKSLS
jgi:Jumping translocation breakpoint protein (JTB)